MGGCWWRDAHVYCQAHATAKAQSVTQVSLRKSTRIRVATESHQKATTSLRPATFLVSPSCLLLSVISAPQCLSHFHLLLFDQYSPDFLIQISGGQLITLLFLLSRALCSRPLVATISRRHHLQSYQGSSWTTITKAGEFRVVSTVRHVSQKTRNEKSQYETSNKYEIKTFAPENRKCIS